MKENPLDKTTPFKMDRPPTVSHYPRKEDASVSKVNITFVLAVIFFGLGYFVRSY